MPFKDFSVGEVLTSADVDEYLMRQTVMVFDDSSARSTSLGTLVAEGMLSFLKDTDQTEFYDGSVWAAIGQDGSIYTGEVGQNAISNGTAGVTFENSISPFLLMGA